VALEIVVDGLVVNYVDHHQDLPQWLVRLGLAAVVGDDAGEHCTLPSEQEMTAWIGLPAVGSEQQCTFAPAQIENQRQCQQWLSCGLGELFEVEHCRSRVRYCSSCDAYVMKQSQKGSNHIARLRFVGNVSCPR
jgi:hypothetical protein